MKGKRAKTTEQFIEDAKKVQGNRFDYSEVKYVNNKTKIKLHCKTCGKDFLQTPVGHLRGDGCPYCAGLAKHSTDSFIEKAKQVHGDKFDYSKVEYINNRAKVCIICKICGKEFWQVPDNHLRGHGCPECRYIKQRLTTEQFIEKARQIHGNKYDYFKVDYKNAETKVCIICPEHGEFWQRPSDHLRGNGCPGCNNSKGEERIKLYLENHNINFIHDEACLEFLDNMRPDFYLPNYNLIIEFDGMQHFEPNEMFGGEKGFKERQELDKLKNQLCEENGVDVLRIPYWKMGDIEKILEEKLL